MLYNVECFCLIVSERGLIIKCATIRRFRLQAIQATLDVLFQLIDNHCILIMTVWRSVRLVEDEAYRNNCAGCACVVDGEGLGTSTNN